LACLPPPRLAPGSIPQLTSYTSKGWRERSCPIEPWVCYLPLTITTRSCTWICVDMLGSYWITPLCGLQLCTPLASKYTRPSLTPDGSPLLMIHSSIPKHVPFSGPPSCLLVGSLALQKHACSIRWDHLGFPHCSNPLGPPVILSHFSRLLLFLLLPRQCRPLLPVSFTSLVFCLVPTMCPKICRISF
jgi:hypothetical protein